VPFRMNDFSSGSPENPLVRIVLPFEGLRSGFRDQDDDGLPWYEMKNTLADQQVLLVYPSSHVVHVLQEAGSAEYVRAKDKIDRGEVEAGLAMLVGLLQKKPKNESLAREVLMLYRVAGMQDKVKDIVRQAVLAGNETSELLLSYADELSRTSDARAALPLYRKAVQSENATGEAFVKLGNAYRQTGRKDIADSCWRRAYWMVVQPKEKQQIREWLGMSASPNSGEP
jgi:predicted Zn-dependent protease